MASSAPRLFRICDVSRKKSTVICAPTIANVLRKGESNFERNFTCIVLEDDGYRIPDDDTLEALRSSKDYLFMLLDDNESWSNRSDGSPPNFTGLADYNQMEKDPQSSTVNIPDDYTSEIGSGSHGEEYQRDVALLMLVRATLAKSDFKMGYEMSAAGKFDDVAFFDENKKEWLLIQTKHADTVKGPPKPIDWNSLLPENKKEQDNSDFSLIKYCKSYVEVQNQIDGCKKFYIFTNKPLVKTILHNFQTCEAHKLLRVAKNDEAFQHVQVKPTDDVVNKLLKYINQDFESLVGAIVELFNSGKVDAVLSKYKTHLANVIVVEKHVLKFHPSFSSNDPDPNIKCLYDSLQVKQIIGKERDNISGDNRKLLIGKSRENIKFPQFVGRTQVEEFLHNMVLSVGQPDDLRSIIENEIRIWIKSWIRPDSFGRLTETQVSLPVTSMNKLFCDFNRIFSQNKKKFLKLVDGEGFFKTIENELRQQLTNPAGQSWDKFEQRYVNRRMVYTDQKEAQEKITDWELVQQMTAESVNQPCLIFIAEPGMGKTTLLQYISFQVQQEDRRHVFLVYLNRLHNHLKEVKEVVNFDKALSVFRDAISESNRNIIKKAASNNGGTKQSQIVIFCDGFDEVHPNHTKQMIQVIQQLMSVKCIKIVISSRKHAKQLLEQSFAVKSMHIDSFSILDQISLFLKLASIEQTQHNPLLASFFKKNQAVINRDSAGSPLMIRMFVEVYSEHIRNILKRNCDENVDLLFPSKPIDIVDLFEKFVRKSFNAKMNKKYGATIDEELSDDENDYFYEKFMLEHQSLALKQLAIAEMLEYSETLEETYKTFTTRIDKGSDKSLLIEKVDDMIRFTHLSFAEYFLAKLLYDRVSEFSSKLRTIFEQNPGMKRFFFIMVEKSEKSKHFKILNELHNEDEVTGTHRNAIAFYACEANCKNLVRHLFKDHDLDSMAHKKMGTMMHVALNNDCPEICQFLIAECGVEPNFLDENGKSPLYKASEHGNAELVKFLIHKGVAVDQMNVYNSTTLCADGSDIVEKEDKWAPLHVAAYNGHVNVCKVLIESGASIDIQQSEGLTPLCCAAQNGHDDVAKLLIESGASVNIIGATGISPLHMAVTIGNADIVKFLIDAGASVDIQDPNESTPIHYAAQFGHTDITQLLIDHNAKVNGKAKYGITPLHMAVLNYKTDIVWLLIGKNASVNAQVADKWTSLHMAARNGNIDIVKLLIESNARVDIKNNSGDIPLHVATVNGHTDIALMLIKWSPVSIHIQNKHARTPLHIAAAGGHLQVAESLIKSGASLDIKDKNEWTPLRVAVLNKHVDVVQLLMKYTLSSFCTRWICTV